MGHLFIVLMMVCAVVSLAYPWIGVLYGYLFVVLTPQAIWWWDFQGVRATFWVILPTCIGVLIGLARRRLNVDILKNRRNLFILLLWFALVVSYFFGAFVHTISPYRFTIPAVTMSRMNKIFFFYFVACLCIDTEKKAKALFVVMMASFAYLTYWAVDQYLTGHWFGRLSGPVSVNGSGLYGDQNDFAMAFVVAQPFFWYFGSNQKRWIWRWAWWLWIPLSWDAVFLTGSRGGFLGLVTTVSFMVLRSRRKLLGLALIPAFLLVFALEAGPVMKTRVLSIDHYHKSGSAEDRLHAWHAAERMILAHPVTGVGVASFGPAYPFYSHHHPREAHDTFFQITAESGVLAGVMYVLIVISLIRSLWRNGIELKRRTRLGETSNSLMINEAVMIGFIGLVVCSVFLSLQEFEIFYVLNVLGNTVIHVNRNISSRQQSDVMAGTLKV
jgi:putative inorganic carbon (HCO3(-)) transporter